MKKEIVLDGNNFSTLLEFYNEVEKKLTNGLGWKIGRNLDACNDVLRGGFGMHEYEEPFTLIWKNSAKSLSDLGYSETVFYIEDKLKRCHPTNISSVKEDLEEAKKGNGETLFEIIVNIIRKHEHIELKFE